jgi:hypothetical protein
MQITHTHTERSTSQMSTFLVVLDRTMHGASHGTVEHTVDAASVAEAEALVIAEAKSALPGFTFHPLFTQLVVDVDDTLCDVHEAGACPPNCPDAYSITQHDEVNL